MGESWDVRFDRISRISENIEKEVIKVVFPRHEEEIHVERNLERSDWSSKENKVSQNAGTRRNIPGGGQGDGRA